MSSIYKEEFRFGLDHDENLDNQIDVIIDIIIDSFIENHEKNICKSDIINMSSN